MRKKKLVIILVSVFTFLILIGGSSYAYFVYNKDISNVSLETGDISLSFSNSNNVTLTNLLPMTDSMGKVNGTYIDFTVSGTVDTDRIYYEVYLVPKDNTTMTSDNIDNYVRTYLTDQNDVKISNVKLYKNLRDSTKGSGKIIYQAIIEPNTNGTTKSENKDFRLRLWLTEDYPSNNSEVFNFNVYLYAINVDEDFELPLDGTGMVRKSIQEKINAETNACNPIWVDDNGTTEDESDDITYFSGTNECVDMNYVWYSGKLWRITAIYPDGAMKLVTENNITSIAFNESSVEFYTDANTTSYMYQWLNEDFYDTLYHASELIDTTKLWNATMPANTTISTKPAETNMVSANVGLLNSYEYYNSYRCVGSAACTGSSYSTGYLNIGYSWWLLNPSDASYVWLVRNLGNGASDPPTNTRGGRPAINLKSGLEFTGSGTPSDPYKIKGDKEKGNPNDLINTRLSGEYVKLVNNDSNQMFRIIGVEDNKTKIISMDYADNKATRNFAANNSDTLWGSGTTTGIDTWYEYLNRVDNSDISNTGYYDKLVKTYGELFTSGPYYLGTSGYNYKLSVCANTTSGNTSVCDKASQTGTFNIGLPRYGEMFATQQEGGYSNSIDMWLMNRYSTSRVWSVNNYGYGINYNPANARVGRPTLHLKSTVKILSGSGIESDPYIVGL